MARVPLKNPIYFTVRLDEVDKEEGVAYGFLDWFRGEIAIDSISYSMTIPELEALEATGHAIARTELDEIEQDGKQSPAVKEAARKRRQKIDNGEAAIEAMDKPHPAFEENPGQGNGQGNGQGQGGGQGNGQGGGNGQGQGPGKGRNQVTKHKGKGTPKR